MLHAIQPMNSPRPTRVRHISSEEEPLTVEEYELSGDTSEERNFSKFTSMYDRSRKTPNYVVELLSINNIPKPGGKLPKRKFKEDMKIHRIFRSTTKDYKDHPVDRTGRVQNIYDKGHLASVGNYPNDRKAREETSILSIIVPQNHDCNEGVWTKLEEYVRKLLHKNKYVTVVSGPLYIPREFDFDEFDEHEKEIIGKFLEKNNLCGRQKIMVYDMMGNVAVPTHFFKVIIIENENSDPVIKGYIVKNAPTYKPVKLRAFEVDVERIEKLSGYLFTAGYIKDKAEKMKETENLQEDKPIPREKIAQIVETIRNIAKELEIKNIRNKPWYSFF